MQRPSHPIIEYLLPFLADLHLSITFFRAHWVLSDPRKTLLKSKDATEIYQLVTLIAKKQSLLFPSLPYIPASSVNAAPGKPTDRYRQG